MATRPPSRIQAAASWIASRCGDAGSTNTRRMTSEPDFHVLRRRDMDAVDEADLMRIVLHDDRARADAVSEEVHTLHQRAVGDAGRREDDLPARREVLRRVDLLEVGDAHRAAAFLVLRLADDE